MNSYAIITNAKREKVEWENVDLETGKHKIEKITPFDYKKGHLCFFLEMLRKSFVSGAYTRIENCESIKRPSLYEYIPPTGIRCRSLSNLIPFENYKHSPSDLPFVYYDTSKNELSYILLKEGEFQILDKDFSLNDLVSIYSSIEMPLTPVQIEILQAQKFELNAHLFLGNALWYPKETYLETASHKISLDKIFEKD